MEYKKNLNFELKLIHNINNSLNKDPFNFLLLEKKAGILAAIGDYNEAYSIFLNLVNSNCSLIDKKRLLLVMNYICKLIEFDDVFKKNQDKLKEFSNDWAKKLLLGIIDSTEQEDSDDILVEKLLSDSKSDDDVFILGPEKEVNNFKYIDSGVFKKFLGIMNYPFAQVTKEGYSYYKEQVFSFHEYMHIKRYRHYPPLIIAKFPTTDFYCNFEYHKPNPKCDVYFTTKAIKNEVHKMLKYSLDKIAKTTKDYFRPKYHNIIDPNLTAVKQVYYTRSDYSYLNTNLIENYTEQWVATDFLIEEYKMTKLTTICSLQLCVKRILKGKTFTKYIIQYISKYLHEFSIGKARIASQIPTFHPKENRELYVAVEEIMTAALPLLCRLRRPSLILPGKLQAVVKAQRIYLNPGEEYCGIWHRDGKYEDIAAVVIYYYRTSPGLEGGDLEFLDKKPIKEELWLYGDCTPEDFTKNDVEKYISDSRVRVPIKEGTLVVFSNYQNIHRVLKMVYSEDNNGDKKSPDGCASRDFIVFFIVDQKSELVNSSQINLFNSEQANKMREKIFEEQITPIGSFGANNDVIHSTGNGCLTQAGWSFTGNMKDEDTIFRCNSGEHYKRKGFHIIDKFILEPELGRGISWALEDNEEDEEEEEEEKNYI